MFVYDTAVCKMKQTSNEPLDENLEDSCNNQGIKQTDSRVVDVPKRTYSDLADEEDSKWNEERHEGSSPYRDDLVAKRVSKLWIDDFSITERDWTAVNYCHHSKFYRQKDSPGKLRLGAGSAK